MARPSNREARRKQIVGGFQKVLAVNGFEKATTASIAEAAGLTTGLIHYHFASKLEILLELVTTIGTVLEARYQRMKEESEGPLDQLAAFIDSRLALGRDASPDLVACWVAIGTEALRLPEVREIYGDLMLAQHRQLQDIVGRISVLNGGGEADTGEVATAILAAIEGCYQLALTVPEIAPAGFASRSVRRMAEGLLLCELPEPEMKEGREAPKVY